MRFALAYAVLAGVLAAAGLGAFLASGGRPAHRAFLPREALARQVAAGYIAALKARDYERACGYVDPALGSLSACVRGTASAKAPSLRLHVVSVQILPPERAAVGVEAAGIRGTFVLVWKSGRYFVSGLVRATPPAALAA